MIFYKKYGILKLAKKSEKALFGKPAKNGSRLFSGY